LGRPRRGAPRTLAPALACALGILLLALSWTLLGTDGHGSGRSLEQTSTAAKEIRGYPSTPRSLHFDTPIVRKLTGKLARGRHAEAINANVRAAEARADAPLAPAGLPINWCGQPRPAGALSPQAAHSFQLVYAHPADQPDHFSLFANELQADASYIDRFVSAESNHTQYIHFVMGTSCGPQYVSLIDWQMPQARSAYAGDGGNPPNFSAIDTAATATFGRPAGVDTLIYVDGLVENPGWSGDTYGGVAEGLYIGDPTPGPSNPNNLGGQFAFLYGLVGGKPAPGEQALDPPTLLHEASHAIGAVSLVAPNSTGAGHCYVMQDIMCYADGGPHGASSDLKNVCGYRNDVMQLPYDCTGDNYYNPNPAPGSYLATHWNLYNSDFMAPCTSDETACGTSQRPVSASVHRGRVTLTLTAVTLPGGYVRVTAGVRGLPKRATASVCMSSVVFSGEPGCHKATARRDAAVTSGTLPAANGEGWRSVRASVRVTVDRRATRRHGRRRHGHRVRARVARVVPLTLQVPLTLA
jgi:hypothetical protein